MKPINKSKYIQNLLYNLPYTVLSVLNLNYTS